MSFWRTLFQSRRADTAPLDEAGIESRVIERIGRRRVFDPVGNHEHAQVASDLRRAAEVDELTSDLRRAESEYARHTSPGWLFFGLVFCFAIEVLGGILIMRAIEARPSERLPLGIGLALAIIALTALASSRTTPDDRPGAAPPRAGVTVLVLAVYSLLVVALAVIRVARGDDEVSRLFLVAESIIMVAVSVGPAWIAEWLIRRHRAARLVKREIKLTRRRLRDAEKSLTRARRFVRDISRGSSAWDDQAARLRARLEIARPTRPAPLPPARTRRNP